LLSNKPGSPPGANPFSWLVQSAYSADIPVQAFDINPQEALSIDSQAAFSTAGSIMRTRINQDLMHSGVAIIDPATTYIDAQVSIGQETVIQPNTYLRGRTSIGRGCQIGPNAMITDTVVGDRCEITFSVAESAVLEDDVDIGPFAHLRKGAHLARGVHMGNYGEVKNSYLGPGTKMGHFSYVGDADIGPGVNIGAGVITANYDGQSKHPTEIGAGAFIGSDTMLIAPVKIGAGARTGAGSVVTKDVPPNSLAVGIPARIIRKEEDQDGP
jgi:bifunctional UDP-N-acetylglucosamine pyrophosphorylase/glucosamine-1-phosphate N-acetyltransferase